ncbi:MAG: thioredoxin domain-containing protein [Firmicutes bacterium]|nr:thioredoxin domain-containing protein [Bacillota bacterium]
MTLTKDPSKACNLLAEESSPYLKQHSLDPVKWHPWNAQALEKAQQTDLPILLSIGYSACHWCHVMQRESFQDETIAQLMNDNFICIKVDREERPDLDDIYQRASLILSGHGGWPLTVFLTPEREPFYGGTYFPPKDRYGRMGFPRLLTLLAEKWKNNRDHVDDAAKRLTRALVGLDNGDNNLPGLVLDPDIGRQLLPAAEQYFTEQYDIHYGGFGDAPKFPSTGILQFLTQRAAGNRTLLPILINTLDKMAQGGIYDQLGGGFHRYSTDDKWLIPHFEKMLYDNALLAEVYLSLYQITQEPSYSRITRETLDYLLRDMQHDDGGFYAAEDADTHGEEGLFYTWEKNEIMEVLGPELGNAICAHYGVTGRGHLEGGRSVLHIAKPDESIPTGDRAQLAEGQKTLLAARGNRVRPFRDEKVITAWNGMAVSALSKAGAVLNVNHYIRRAEQAADFILTNLMHPDGRLYRSIKDGSISVPGFLEDYAYFAKGLIDLYSASLNNRWLESAVSILKQGVELFWDPDSQVFYDTEENAELLFRPSSPTDASYPSPFGVMLENFFRLQSVLPTSTAFKADDIDKALAKYLPQMEEHPWGFAGLYGVLDLVEIGSADAVVLGDRSDENFQQLLRVLQTSYWPGLIIHNDGLSFGNGQINQALWQDKSPMKDKATVYICHGNTCHPPVNDADELKGSLQHLPDRMVIVHGMH